MDEEYGYGCDRGRGRCLGGGHDFDSGDDSGGDSDLDCVHAYVHVWVHDYAIGCACGQYGECASVLSDVGQVLVS